MDVHKNSHNEYSCNRIRKAIFDNTDPEALPIINIDNPSGGWVMQSEEFYSRGADGLELAIYRNTGSGVELKQHNIFAGSDNAGKLLPENIHNYYIKDHLGSIRVILDIDRQVLSANDYDAWGYYLEGRGYEQTPNYETPNYKFTSKERDRESNYDYFGARYYDSRIGRWGQVEPLMDKYVSFSTYCYGLNNPIVMVDLYGLDVRLSNDEDTRNQQLNIIRLGLPSEYNDYVNSTQDADGNHIIDETLLSSASNLTESIEYNRLLTIVQSQEITTISFDHQVSYRNNYTGEVDVINLGLMPNGNYMIGQTLVSGNIDNPTNPEIISMSGANEVYIYNVDDVEDAVTLAHEFYVHVYNYIRGNNWQENQLSGDGGEIRQIENKAGTNATNR